MSEKLRVRFTYPDGTWRAAEMLECPRVGEYVDAGLAGYHVAAVRWEPFQQEEDNPPPDLAYDVRVELRPGVAPLDRHLPREGE